MVRLRGGVEGVFKGLDALDSIGVSDTHGIARFRKEGATKGHISCADGWSDDSARVGLRRVGRRGV